MTIRLNKILDLFKKENRPLLRYERRKRLGLNEKDNVEIYDEATKRIIEPSEWVNYIPEIYIWVDKGNDTSERRKDTYRFAIEPLEEFWLNEITFLLRTANSEREISYLIRELGKQLVSYYNLKDPLGESLKITSDAGLGENKNATLLKFLDKHEQTFYVRQIYGDLSNSRGSYMVGLRVWEGKVLSEDIKIIRNQMLKILRNHPKQEMSLGDLVYSINRIQLSTLTKKPYSEVLIKEILFENQGRFIFDTFKNLIKKSDDIEYIISSFKSNIKSYSDFAVSPLSEGLLAITFIGKEFPLKEAQEYVKTRPIIFITSFNNSSTSPFTTSSIFDNWNITNYILSDWKILLRELKKYLLVILDKDVEKEDWLMQNIGLSYYEENMDQIRLLEPRLIEKLSPVFNVQDNPGNLFQFTLEKLLEEKKNK